MRRNNLKFFAIFLVFAIAMYFVAATSYDLVTSGQTAKAGETVSLLAFNISSVTGISGHNLTTLTLILTGNASVANITSVNISDGTNDFSNGSITGTTITIDTSNVNASALGNTNLTIKATLNSSATYGVAFGLDISSVGAQANVTVDITTNSSLVIVTESTAPTATAVVANSQTKTSITTDFSSSKCSDSGATSSGILTCVLSSSSGTVDVAKITGLSCSSKYDITVTATDKSGNKASKLVSLSTQACGGSGGIVTERPKKASYSFSKITPGVATILKNFDAEIGVKEIKIEVNNEAQSVSITVTKYNDKPAAVSVGKTGKVYQYLEIQENNLAGKLDKATVTLRVTKSWISSNGLDAEDVALFRFDDSSGVWNEMSTTYIGSEGDNELYDVELMSFSFFAISESEGGVIDEDGERRTETGEGAAEGGGNTFLIILIILVVLVLIGWGMKKRK